MAKRQPKGSQRAATGQLERQEKRKHRAAVSHKVSRQVLGQGICVGPKIGGGVGGRALRQPGKTHTFVFSASPRALRYSWGKTLTKCPWAVVQSDSKALAVGLPVYRLWRCNKLRTSLTSYKHTSIIIIYILYHGNIRMNKFHCTMMTVHTLIIASVPFVGKTPKLFLFCTIIARSCSVMLHTYIHLCFHVRMSDESHLAGL